MKFSSYKVVSLGVVFAVLSTCVVPAFAKNGSHDHEGRGKAVKPIHLKFSIIPSNSAFTDLLTAKGKGSYEHEKKVDELKLVVRLPLTSPTLGITDKTTASALALHAEFLDKKTGSNLGDCLLSFQEGDDDSDHYQYRLFVKTKGKTNVHGSCTISDGSKVPALSKENTITVYGLVNNVRTDFLKN